MIGRRKRELAELRDRVQELLRAHRRMREQVENLQTALDDRDRIHAEIVADLADLAGVPAHGTLRDRIRELMQKERRLARVYTVLEAPPEVTVQVVKVEDAGKELPVPDKPGSVKP